tara:strand:- start:279 stop:863 length:585 start_codon:yes stop_codon:yes gene_type:complete
MKLLLISIFIISNIFAQNGFTLVGGYNMSKIKYNDDDVAENVDIDSKGTINVGLETRSGNLILGGSFLQRGSQFEFSLMGYEFEGYDIYNYGAVHILYPTSLGEGFEGFGGIQAGLPLGGEVHIESGADDETEDIDADELSFDAGLLLGANFMINEQFGLRASYYMGLTDVADGTNDDENYKNNTLSFSVLINF